MAKTKSLFCLSVLMGGILGNNEIKLSQVSRSKHYSDQETFDLISLVEDDNPLCARWNDDICLECAPRTYFNQEGICVQIDPQCKNFDFKSKRCTACYPGYQILYGKCTLQAIKLEQDWATTNPLCAAWIKKRCIKCSPQSYFNPEKICVMVDPDCKTYTELNGNCLSCFEGYELDRNGRCLKVQHDWKSKDPLCSKWNSLGHCIECAPKSYKNREGFCRQVDPNCYTHLNETGQCTSCYKGYGLKNGKCIEQTQSIASTNPYCARWEGTRCLKCATRTYLNAKTGICVASNPLCRTFTETNGDCTSCYPGFKLSEGKCTEAKNNYAETNPLCAQWMNEKCIRCSNRSYFNKDGRCTAVDPYCATFNQNSGVCLSCYVGYEVSNGKCVIKNVGPSSFSLSQNPLCSQWKGQTCTKCAARSYFEENGICTEIDPYCQKFSEEKKICTKCYSGYKLNKNLKGCVLPGTIKTSPSPQQNPKGSDPNCKIFNPNERICEECYNDLVPIADKCVRIEKEVSFDQEKCMKWKEGRCLECSKGLQINSVGLCVCR